MFSSTTAATSSSGNISQQKCKGSFESQFFSTVIIGHVELLRMCRRKSSTFIYS